MSTGTNKERLTQNNGIINENNSDLTALKTRINNLPTSGDTTATASDIALGKTAVSKGVKITGTYTPPTVSLQSKDVTINQNGTTTITADTGYDGLSDVDVTVSGILDTSDANATSGDIARNKTAYVNNQKLTGTVYDIDGGAYVDINYYNYSNDTSHSQYIIRGRNEIDRLYRAYTYPAVNIPYNTLATIVGAEASKIKKDEVICGVTGTYEGTKAVLPDGIKFGAIVSFATDFSWLADVDTSGITNTSSMFLSCTRIQNASLFDTSNVTEANQMFYNCQALESVPLYDFSNVTQMAQIFRSCVKLKTIPLLNTNKVTLLGNAFADCPLLSNDSLNNILAMCTNSAVTTGKTLYDIGLSSTQATTCQTLSNWDAFVAAGWSSGY